MQNPYINKDARNFIKKKEDEESSQSARTKQAEQEQKTQQAPKQEQQAQQEQPKQPINQYNNSRGNVYQRLKESKQAQAQATASRDANLKNATVNIAQIMKDFKSTAAAIATPDELNEEVNSYLALVESQVKKEEPNTKIVRSNLKNAAALLDGYITQTLQRPSQVVENWLDALFLQQINYSFNEEEINPQFLVKFPGGKKTEEAEETQESESSEETTEESTVKTVIVPQDDELKKLFVQAKKYSYTNEQKKALQIFNQALKRSIEVQDTETRSKVLYEIGKIYDKNDYLSKALSNYNESLTISQDTNVKTQAHYSMAQIYDDIAEFEPAINHYLSSISYAGESENLSAQSASLAKIGNIYSDTYEKDAFEYLSEAKLLANQTKDSKIKGYVSSSIGNAYSKFNEPQNALKSYFEACQEYQNSDSPTKVAQNYKKAAEIMEGYENKAKAKSLLEKALTNAQKADDNQLINEIRTKLNSL